jgi:hypothetical protein
MNIQKMGSDMAQQRVQESASVMVQSKAINNMREQGAAVQGLINSASASFNDPMKGNLVNMMA